MRNKLYLLLAVLSVIVICAAATDEGSQRSDSTTDVKKTVVVEDPVDDHDKDKSGRDDDEDDIDDSYSSKSSYAHNRFLSYNPPEDNYRTRSRWPAASALPSSPPMPALSFSMDDFADDNDWPSAGYGSAFPTSASSNSYNMYGMSNNAPSCNSLIDQQYPIFSDTCGAVPQARYSLPNALGHREKWQVAHLLNVIMSSSTEPSCTRSLRLLLCPILFPSCSTRQQSPPVLPCQSFCRVVKSRCAIPMLESLPCEVLPYSSDLCPTNQAHGSFAPPRALPNNMQPSPMTGGHPASRQYPTLQSILSSPALQAALSGQNFQSGMNPQVLQAAFAGQNFQSGLNPQALQGALSGQNFQSGMNPQALHAALSGQNFHSGVNPQALQAAFSGQNFQSGMNPQALQAAFAGQNFQSGLNSQALQAALSAQAYQPPLPPQTYHVASPFAPQAAPQAAPPAPVTTTPPPPPAPTTPPTKIYNAAQFPNDAISGMLGDFGSRTYGNEYRQNSRYGPYMRSSTDVRPATDLRAPTETRQPVASRPRNEANTQPAARPPTASSMVKA